MKKQKIEITVNHFEYPVTVELWYTPGVDGIRHGFDRFADPDDPDEIEIISIYCDDDPETQAEAERELNEAWLMDKYYPEIQEAYEESILF